MMTKQPLSPALGAFGEAIKAERTARGWSLSHLAGEALENPDRKGYCSQVEKGQRRLSEYTIATFARVLDLPSKVTDPLTGHLLPQEDDVSASDTTVTKLLKDVETLRDKLKLSEALAVAITYKYADGNPTDIEGALKGVEAALELAAKDQERGRLPSNYEDAAEVIIQRVNALNDAGEIDQAYAELKADVGAGLEGLEAQKATLSRKIDLLITQAALANDAKGYAQAHLQKVQLDSPNAEDSFRRLRALQGERYEEGLRLGTPFALSAAAGLARQCAEIAPTAYLRAMAHNDLGIALQFQGNRTDGAAGNALLAEAVESYRAALRVRTEAEHPVDWAMTMQNLATALETQGSRSEGPEGMTLLAEAVESYRAALRVRTEAERPVDWAMTMQNLAAALQTQGIRSEGPEGMALLAEAIESYRAALRVFTEAEYPVNWAGTMHNLANSLGDQGNRTEGPEGKALLAEAVESYRAALRVYSEAEYPVDWAETQESLAHTELERAQHGTTTESQPHLEAALAYVDNALRIFDPVHLSFYHAKATRLRERILAKIRALPPSSSS